MACQCNQTGRAFAYPACFQAPKERAVCGGTLMLSNPADPGVCLTVKPRPADVQRCARSPRIGGRGAAHRERRRRRRRRRRHGAAGPGARGPRRARLAHHPCGEPHCGLPGAAQTPYPDLSAATCMCQGACAGSSAVRCVAVASTPAQHEGSGVLATATHLTALLPAHAP
jgi:hypothetical protein